MKLIIAEKPSVGISIAKALSIRNRQDGYIEGDEYIISWCFGHLVELADAKQYDAKYERWTIEDLPIVPKEWKYSVLEDKQTQFDTLVSLMSRSDVTSLVCATDSGREGELIFRLVYQEAGCQKPFERLWISSMEDQAIQDGMKNLRNGHDYDRLYASANCRAHADWIVGINATRLFTCLYRTPLSVGRVQTPTLAMLVEREKRIADFSEEKSYSVRLDCDCFFAESDNMSAKDAEALKSACQNQPLIVENIDEKNQSTGSPKLYDLTTLQRDANRLYGMTAQETLDVAQKLYEKKMITYPRTDSQYILQSMKNDACNMVAFLIEKLPWAQGIQMDINLDKSVNDAKVVDHHAILPTKQLVKSEQNSLTEDERKILDLVSLRLLLSAASPYISSHTRIDLSCAQSIFHSKGKVTMQEGWKGLQKQLKAGSIDEDDVEEQDDLSLPPMQLGQKFTPHTASLIEHKTTAPRHFTEDTLLSAMETAGNDELDKSLDTEKRGLGTPATRAAIIERLLKSGLAVRNKKQILPTEKGEKLISVVPEIMKSPVLTAQWENQLTEIASGQREADEFNDEILQILATVMQEKKTVPTRSFVSPPKEEREVIGKCPRCGSDVYETKSNFRCIGNDCHFALWKDALFFTNKKKVLKKTAAKSLLKTGKAKMRGFVSEKTGKKYDAVVVMEDTGGKYVKYHLEFE